MTKCLDLKIYIGESRSLASVSLALRWNGEVEIQRTCTCDCIDGDGCPQREKQLRFLDSSIAARETDISVKPLGHSIAEGTVSITFPYDPSHSLTEIAIGRS